MIAKTATRISAGLAIILVAIAALPADAVTVPTPGWVGIANNMQRTSDDLCEGDVSIEYALKAVDKARAVRAVLNPDCSLTVLRLVPDVHVSVGTTGPVSVWAEGYQRSVVAEFLESLGTQCTRIAGRQGGEGGGLSPESSTPTPYGAGCNAGWRQTWSGSVTVNGRHYWVWDTIEAGLSGFGVAHCRDYISASDGSSGSFLYDCHWDDGSTISYSAEVVIDERVEMEEIAFIHLEPSGV